MATKRWSAVRAPVPAERRRSSRPHGHRRRCGSDRRLRKAATPIAERALLLHDWSSRAGGIPLRIIRRSVARALLDDRYPSLIQPSFDSDVVPSVTHRGGATFLGCQSRLRSCPGCRRAHVLLAQSPMAARYSSAVATSRPSSSAIVRARVNISRLLPTSSSLSGLRQIVSSVPTRMCRPSIVARVVM
jgi:hypothetical protein